MPSKAWAAHDNILTPDAFRASLGGYDSGGNNMLGERVARLEATCDHILLSLSEVKSDIKELRRNHERDFRISIAFAATSILGILALMAKTFGWIS